MESLKINIRPDAFSGKRSFKELLNIRKFRIYRHIIGLSIMLVWYLYI